MTTWSSGSTTCGGGGDETHLVIPSEGDAVSPSTTRPEVRTWQAGTLVYTRESLVRLFSWLLWGDFALYLRDRSMDKIKQVVFGQYHIPAVAIGLLSSSLPVVVNFAIGPVLAYHSDRHRGRWGRRIPFLFALLPLVAVSVVGLAFSPQIGIFLHHSLGRWSPGPRAMGIAAVTFFAALVGLSSALPDYFFTGLITDVVPREWFGRFFAWLRIVSLLAGIVFDLRIMGLIPEHWPAILIGLGGVFCVSFAALCFNVKEGEYPPPPPPVMAPGPVRPGLLRRFAAGTRSYCRDCFKHPYYRWIFAAAVLAQVAIGPVGIYDVFLARSFGTSMGQYGRFGAVQSVVAIAVSYLTGWLVDRFHCLRITLVALGIVSAAAWAAFFLVHNAMTFGLAVIVCGTLSGFWYTAQSSLASMPPTTQP